jgi:hypothetical protein
MASAATARSNIAFYVERRLFGAAIAIGRRPAGQRQPRVPPPGHADLTFTYAELGVDPGAPLAVLNPLVEEPIPRRSVSTRKDQLARRQGIASAA